MSSLTLFDNVWERHKVRSLPNDQDQILIGCHLIHEVTSPQAFSLLEKHGLSVRYPQNVFATVDHIVPTENRQRPLRDPMAETMLQHLERNTEKYNIPFFNLGDERQGVVHIVGPEQGITQPGMTIVCGDSHTSTHGAFGSIAFGIGTTQIACALATGCLLLEKPKVRKITVTGKLSPYVTAKDIILYIINTLGDKGGIGYAYEYTGNTIHSLSMEERMTVCNMSIEGGARYGYINPDEVTYDYMRGRPYAPPCEKFNESIKYWESIKSHPGAVYDDEIEIDAASIKPMITYGTSIGESVAIDDTIPSHGKNDSLNYMKFTAGETLLGSKLDVAFIGSCTNGRISDLRDAALYIEKHGLQVAKHVKAIVVPGSEQVRMQAEQEGLDKVFKEAGWEWRSAGCSMCLAMNPDKLIGDQLCASSSNRNFVGRQGSPTGRTLVMSPVSVVACASFGYVADVRKTKGKK